MSHPDRRTMLGATAALTFSPWSNLLLAADPYADGKLIAGEPPKPKAGSFTVAVLPDTQNYSEKFPETFLAQTKWIAENQSARNIQWMLHLGDITNRNSVPEWQNAQRALTVLDEAKIPYAFCPGNHDYSTGGGCKDRTTLLNDYLPVSRYSGSPTFGGTYDREPKRMENSYHLFDVKGRKFVILALEFGPRNDVIRWANEILTKYHDREAILITHAFIYFDDTRYNFAKYGAKQNWNPHAYPVAKTTKDDVNDGEEIWNKLIAKHENVILTLNGHVLGDGLGRVTTSTPSGRAVPQILVNYQMRPKGGDGWLRLLEFQADGTTVEVYDYSPTLKQRNESAQNRFTFSVAPIRKA
ncbi:metallophosphoesterase [Tuwongella immobilis]|uniref:Calcineurin-like phosphoesterase domain-containing protein n=1 Tax=Tuwongella immobilis TaxID=692036 RepID=A0A6C2YRW6_9BACT|nr:metallophosphoesterase [Tuwongella immobilis]VIP04101.1 metallophosphoesterase : Metallophosphoesterase OS=Pirellula staleyi (strain ATCC 27377 / DSM 6068 / ICPB 4128) GN=Psta_0573 PE=4 SV=1: Metallophos [Tuwongella immobilis]VTS05569.1 metallophosphoesterase : Metallophosphoesterase OS=Pirellula staleyi (strain ATCC 27377 / DSM 6068 / ICPB 4128) GN=Psta_0573 PE=4 SV=1: Metallophos [Tuwongella immobilis]